MIAALLAKLFGPHWRTSALGILAAFFLFVAFSPEDFSRFPVIVHLAKFAAVGGLAALGLQVPDKNQINK